MRSSLLVSLSFSLLSPGGGGCLGICVENTKEVKVAAEAPEEEEKKEEKRREREKGRWCLQIAIESGRLEISNGALKAEKEKQSGKTTEHRNTMVSDPFREREGGLAWLGLIKHGETCAL